MPAWPAGPYWGNSSSRHYQREDHQPGPAGQHRGRTCNGTVSYVKAVSARSGRVPAGSLAYVPVPVQPGCDLDAEAGSPAGVALGDGDLRVRKSSVTDYEDRRPEIRR